MIWLAIAGFVASAVLHALALAGFVRDQMRWIIIGLEVWAFLVAVPAYLNAARRSGELGRISAAGPLRHCWRMIAALPAPFKWLARAFALYAVLGGILLAIRAPEEFDMIDDPVNPASAAIMSLFTMCVFAFSGLTVGEEEDARQIGALFTRRQGP